MSETQSEGFSSLAGLLGTYIQKPELKGAWYNNQKFTIDGYRFVECRFDNCTLYVNTGEFEFERCMAFAI